MIVAPEVVGALPVVQEEPAEMAACFVKDRSLRQDWQMPDVEAVASSNKMM